MARSRHHAAGIPALVLASALAGASESSPGPAGGTGAADRPVTQRVVDVWQESSGLPQNYVFCVLQTRDGYLWVGTRGGLARFDGVRFVTFDDRRANELRDSEVWALAEDPDGALWVGTYGGGLTRYRDGVFTTFTTRDGLPSDWITALASGPGGELWVGTTAGLACRRGARFTSYTDTHELPRGAVRALHVDRHGVLWIGTEQGLASYASGTFVDRARSSDELSGLVTAIAGDSEDGLWLTLWRAGGHANGVRLLRGGRVTSYSVRDGLPSDTAMSLALDADGTASVGTVGGVCRFRNGRFESHFADVSSLGELRSLESVWLRGIPSLLVDREGSLWFGTRYDGLGRLRDSPSLRVAASDSDRDVDVRALLEDPDGSLWLSTALDLRRLRNGRVERYELEPQLAASGLARSARGTLVVGSSRGLFEWAKGRVRRVPVPGAEALDVAIVFTDRAGTTWIGTRSDGLYALSRGGLTRYHSRDPLLGRQVRAIAEDGRGALWVGTRDGGVSVLHAGQVTTFGPAQGLASGAVQALCVDREGDVWVATRQGLNRIRAGRVATVSARQGLPANFFYQILEDGQDLWLTYASGIARLAKSALREAADGKLDRVTPVLFGAASGMRSTSMTVAHQPTALRARDGRLWFATARGAVVIDPRSIRRNTLPPPVHVEEVRIRHDVYPARDGLTLPPLDSELAIAYTGLSFVAPEQVRFRFRLEGLDADWVEAGTRRTAYYTNLPPGPYRFRVTACNNDGVWNEAGASFAFRVLPRWHQRGSLRALGLMALALCAVGAHRLRTTQLRARERKLSARVEERTHELHELTLQLEARVGERTAELATANAALTAEKERLAVTLRSIGDGVIATDIEARVVLMNRVAEQLTGWKAAEAEGRPLEEVLRTVDRTSRTPLRDLARNALERGGGFDSPCLLLTRDGRERLVADSAAPIRDPASRVVGAVFVFRDVTERERMEEQLRNSQKLEALGVLAGGIAHDFNNLLSGIFGCVDLARARAGNPPKAREALDRALSVMGKAKGLTQQLLTFARAGEPVRRPLLLAPLVKDAAGFVLSGSNVVAELRIPERLWPCQADEQQLNQVVDNLILNARQAMPAGGTVSVSLANVELATDVVGRLPAGPYVVLAVRDEGPGIPRELWSRIFEPFFTTKPRGTGLGLSTVYSIVRQHGGHVELESEIGVGTTFRVYLPALPDGTPGPGADAVAAQAQPGAGRVLVMDDEAYLRETLQQSLESLGYQVLAAEDDEQALRLLREAQERGERIDVAILDLTIPGGHGGREALLRLRTLAPDLPGIASSGYSGEAVMARPAEHGFAGALRKPYTIAELGTVVAHAIRAGSGARSTEA